MQIVLHDLLFLFVSSTEHLKEDKDVINLRILTPFVDQFRLYKNEPLLLAMFLVEACF